MTPKKTLIFNALCLILFNPISPSAQGSFDLEKLSEAKEADAKPILEQVRVGKNKSVEDGSQTITFQVRSENTPKFVQFKMTNPIGSIFEGKNQCQFTQIQDHLWECSTLFRPSWDDPLGTYTLSEIQIVDQGDVMSDKGELVSLNYSQPPSKNLFKNEGGSTRDPHRISEVAGLGYNGHGVGIGVLEISGSSTHHGLRPELTGHLSSTSKFPDFVQCSHGTNVVSIISAKPDCSRYALGASIRNNYSVASGARVHYHYGTEMIEFNAVVSSPVTERSAVFPAWELERSVTFLENTINHKISQQDHHEIHHKMPSGLGQAERVPYTHVALSELASSDVSAVNISRGIVLAQIDILESLKKLLEKKPLLFQALGNQGLSFDIWNGRFLRAALEDVNRDPDDSASIHSFLGEFKFLSAPENQDVLKSFIFVMGLDEQGQRKASFSNMPGDFNKISQRTIAVVAEKFDELRGANEISKQTLSGTSFASPLAAATFALLKQAFPKCENEKLAEAMLDSCTYQGLVATVKGQEILASELPESVRLSYFGRGKLDAKAALDLAKTEPYCHTALHASKEVISLRISKNLEPAVGSIGNSSSEGMNEGMKAARAATESLVH